jgi:hypothetical protein
MLFRMNAFASAHDDTIVPPCQARPLRRREASRILDDAVTASRVGAGILRFSTQDGAHVSAIVTPLTRVVISDAEGFVSVVDSAAEAAAPSPNGG